MKWQFVPKDSPKPKYLCANADESEPGTFKDHILMERNPHLLLEGCAIGCYAIGARVAYIYIRGEFLHVQRVLEAAIAEARGRGLLGTNLFGSGFDCEIFVHPGAGAYEAGEESALLESLEGKRAQPRLRPPFPAVVGLYGCPTAINNVETLCNVPLIVERGPSGSGASARRRTAAEALLHQRARGQARCLRGVDARHAAGADLRPCRRHPRRARAQGGHPGRIVDAGAAAETPGRAGELRGPAPAGSMLGSAAMIVMDDTTCMVWAAENLLHFYRHESCGKCTPCREGTDWLLKLLRRIERGEGA